MSFSLLEDFAKAIENGDSKQIEFLLDTGSIDINDRLPREHNPPPLVFAVRCEARDIDIVKTLLNAGADIDGCDDNRQTVLFAATSTGSIDVVNVLLAHRSRPDLDIKDKTTNQSSLELSLRYGHERDFHRISVALINAGASLADLSGPLSTFASRSTSAIQALLNRGVAVNLLCDFINSTPLHMLAFRRDCDADGGEVEAVIQMLINDCGVDLEARDACEWTCTFAAASALNSIALRCFIDAGADVNRVTRAGHTALHSVSDYNCAILLLAAGANVNARSRDGRAPFQPGVTVGWNWTSILPAFVAAGGDASDVYGPNFTDLDAERVETARRDIARTRLDFVRHRAFQLCVGLHSLNLDALQTCEILQHACGRLAHLIAFHQWWAISTTVKHFHRH
jgi:ankyrin repeat protein